MTRKDREKLRYTVVRNVTKNPKLAQKARGWSEERIYTELNIVIPKKTIKVKNKVKDAESNVVRYQMDGFAYKYKEEDKQFILQPIKLKALDKTKKNKYERMQQNKITYAVKSGLEPLEAYSLRYKTYKDIDLAIKFNNEYKPDKKKRAKTDVLRLDRLENFKDWTKQEKYPPNFIRQARMINLKKGLDINDSFGFGVMYYAYINNREPEHFIKQFKWDKMTQRIIYPQNITL